VDEHPETFWPHHATAEPPLARGGLGGAEPPPVEGGSGGGGQAPPPSGCKAGRGGLGGFGGGSARPDTNTNWPTVGRIHSEA